MVISRFVEDVDMALCLFHLAVGIGDMIPPMIPNILMERNSNLLSSKGLLLS